MAFGIVETKTLDISPASPKRLTKKKIRFLLYLQIVIMDCIAIFLAFESAEFFRSSRWFSFQGAHFTVVAIPLYLMFAFNNRAISADIFLEPLDGIRSALKALAVTFMAILLVIFLMHTSNEYSRLALFIGASVSAVLLILGRSLLFYQSKRLLGETPVDTLLIVDGVQVQPSKHSAYLDVAQLGMTPTSDNPEMLDRFGQIFERFDRVVVACSREAMPRWSLLMKGASIQGEILFAAPEKLGVIGVAEYRGNETVVVSRDPLSLPNRIKKRVFDLLLTIPALIVLLPLLMITAIAIKLDSRGPVLFRQQRVGRSNRLFNVYKFRSMHTDLCDSNGNESTQREDRRTTRVGKFIRKTSIDELPQLINVLEGDMSLVGPRPHALGSTAEAKLFWDVDERYWLRHTLKPGITGLAQIRGYRGATHKTKDLSDRLQADLEYINGWRFGKDISILIMTVRVLIHSKAY